MKRSDVRSDLAVGKPTGSEPPNVAVAAVPPSPWSSAEPVSFPVGPVVGVLGVLCGARDVVARASRVPLGDADCETLADVSAAAAPLCSATDAPVLAVTAALEAKRTVDTGEQVAQMPNVARGLSAGELNAEHAAVLADSLFGMVTDRNSSLRWCCDRLPTHGFAMRRNRRFPASGRISARRMFTDTASRSDG